MSLAGDSAIEFTSGQITSLAGSLDLNGNDAFIEDSTALGSNSALTGLASIGKRAALDLENEAAVSTTGALVNAGGISLDTNGGGGSSLTVGGTLTNSDTLTLGTLSASDEVTAAALVNTGDIRLFADKSSLTVGGTLTNSGYLSIGDPDFSGSDKVTAAALDNAGTIYLSGSAANQELLDVTGAAGFGTAGVLSGDVEPFDSAIEFASGQITSLASGAILDLAGNNAFIEDSTALGSNSALTGLASIGAGALFLLNGNGQLALSTTGALVNDGSVELNPFGGGSSLTVGGTLTNSGKLEIGSAGSIDLLDVAGSAGFGTAGVLSGYVEVAGDSAIEFASGQITTIAGSATLFLEKNDAFIEDSTALGSNSALTGLASIGAGATLDLGIGASLSTAGALANNGLVELDPLYYGSGSYLTVAGTLTNTDLLEIGNRKLSSSDSVTAKSFVNSGTVELTGHRTNLAALDVSGATTNNGAICIPSDTEELAGAVSGKGSFSLLTANLVFDFARLGRADDR